MEERAEQSVPGADGVGRLVCSGSVQPDDGTGRSVEQGRSLFSFAHDDDLRGEAPGETPDERFTVSGNALIAEEEDVRIFQKFPVVGVVWAAQDVNIRGDGDAPLPGGSEQRAVEVDVADHGQFDALKTAALQRQGALLDVLQIAVDLTSALAVIEDDGNRGFGDVLGKMAVGNAQRCQFLSDTCPFGVVGSKEDCENIKAKIRAFLAERLKLELSDEKTLITHSAEYARFLGYDVRVRRNGHIKNGGQGYSQRTLSNKVELNVPLTDKIEKYLFNRKAVMWADGALRPVHRGALVTMTDLEILMVYNAELRGICNYYGIASNFGKLGYFAYLMEYSCLMTLASKHKSSVSKMLEQFKDGKGGWCIPYETHKGKKYMYFAKYQECKAPKDVKDAIPHAVPQTIKSHSSFESRLLAKQCEFCGSMDSKSYEVHHVHKLKDLKGKSILEQVMLARRRKTIVLCEKCHHNLHNGKA